MFRYRCPQCGQLLQALEMRAGKTTVCSKCSRPLTIPADRADWLDEQGQPLNTAGPSSGTIPVNGPSSGVVPVNGPSSSILTADTVRRAAALPSFNPLDDFDLHAPIVLGDDDDVVNLTPPEVIPPAPPPQPLAPPPRKVYEALPTPAPRPAPVVLPPPPPPAPAVEAPQPPATPAAMPSANGAKRGESERTEVFDMSARRPGRVVATTPAPPPRTPAPPRTPPPARTAASPPRGESWPEDETDAVSFSAPTRLRSQMDIAAELSMVLSTRMKPAPEPPRDLKPSTAVWLLLTGLALSLLVVSLVTASDSLKWVGFLGAIQVAVGYVWIVWMAFRRAWQRGVACAVPPATFYYLFQKKYARYRPLRFVLTGAALIGVAVLAARAQPQTREWTGVKPAVVADPPQDVTKQSKLVQLREYREQGPVRSLLIVLESLTATDQDLSKEARQRPELAAELRKLCAHDLPDVKTAALGAYVRWAVDDADAQRLCLAALRSPHEQERIMAIRQLPKWKDSAAASLIASSIAGRLGRRGQETTAAVAALVEIGGRAAEQAAIPVLESEDQPTRMVAMELLEKVGGPAAVDALLDEKKQILHQDPATHRVALLKAAALKERLQKQKR